MAFHAWRPYAREARKRTCQVFGHATWSIDDAAERSASTGSRCMCSTWSGPEIDPDGDGTHHDGSQ